MQFDPAEDLLISKDTPPVSLIQQTLERILLTFDKKFSFFAALSWLLLLA